MRRNAHGTPDPRHHDLHIVRVVVAWGVAHIYFLIGFRNRMAVAIDWLWSYLTYQRGARLITGQDM